MRRSSIKRLVMTGTMAIVIAGVTVGTALGTHHAGRSDMIRNSIEDGTARNVIFFLGDGMGTSEVTIARNYELGAAGRFAGLDALPFSGYSTTWAVQESNPSLPEYVTDSAAAATAWATGHKTANGRLSTTAGTDRDLTTILELAKWRGYATGNVSNADITDATPAALDSHVSNRDCYGPADMGLCPTDKKSAGGAGSIAEQTVDHGVDVVLGGGKSRFDQVIPAGEPNAGKTVTQTAVDQGYQVVTDRSGLSAAKSGKKLLGLFAPVHMTTDWTGTAATAYPGTAAQTCNEAYRAIVAPNEPSLVEMTKKALDVLDAKTRGHRNGFFLQVEGALIDKQDHAQNPCAQIGDTVAFDQSIQLALAYAKRHPDTLIIVTADHGQTSQIVSAPQSASHHSPGATATLVTADGANMVVNYATTMPGTSQDHTGTEVPVMAQGPQAANVLGVNDETDLFDLMNRAMSGFAW
jgi:alkaline phosphatase